jgi:prepilin-type N-terminal cleavage/methylation domain-containing protein
MPVGQTSLLACRISRRPSLYGCIAVANRAFSLVELLVSIAIISVLLSVAAPCLVAAREQARIVGCTQRLRQLALSVRIYADSHRVLPVAPPVSSMPMLELSSASFRCPSDSGTRIAEPLESPLSLPAAAAQQQSPPVSYIYYLSYMLRPVNGRSSPADLTRTMRLLEREPMTTVFSEFAPFHSFKSGLDARIHLATWDGAAR